MTRCATLTLPRGILLLPLCVIHHDHGHEYDFPLDCRAVSSIRLGNDSCCRHHGRAHRVHWLCNSCHKDAWVGEMDQLHQSDRVVSRVEIPSFPPQFLVPRVLVL